MGKLDPLAGVQLTLAPGQLSLKAAGKEITFDVAFGAVKVLISAGHVTTGASASFTLTVKLHRLVLPLASVAVQRTVFMPLANVEPLTGSKTTVTPGQLSVTAVAM